MKKVQTFIKSFPLLIVAVILAVGILSGAMIYKNNRDKASSSQTFSPSSVLPQAVSQPAATTAYDANSLKEYDGKDGHKCYVAIKGNVYEIKDNSYWKDGEHTPSGGRGICGGDMTEVIKQSPHGESVLGQLPKVGTYNLNGSQE